MADPSCKLRLPIEARRAAETVSDARAEALLKSALEKIVYFEARSGQLEADASAALAEVDRLKAELAAAGALEVELRGQLAERDVTLARVHRDRDELGRVVETLRAERTALLDKLLDAASIRGVLSDEDGSFDLAAFISQLRSEVLTAKSPPEGVGQRPAASEGLPREPIHQEAADDAVAFQAEVARQMAQGVWGEASEAPPVPPPPPAARPALGAVGRREERPARAVLQLDAEGADWAPAASARRVAPAAAASPTTTLAERLWTEGRLGRRRATPDWARPAADDTLYGFSVRELSAPEAAARVRAAERLGALGERRAAPALATALHAEREPRAVVAFLEALRRLAGKEGAAVVEPFADAPSPEVRIAALRALVTLDAQRAVPQLQRAARDADASVRRRATLLRLQLPAACAAALECPPTAEADPEVRRVSALAAGATGGREARATLLAALDDSALEVRQAAARSLSRLLGVGVEDVAALEGPPRRREIRRLTALPAAPVSAGGHPPAQPTLVPVAQTPGRTEVAVVEAMGPLAAESVGERLLVELQSAMRGCTLAELVRLLGAPPEAIESACALLTARGQVVRRGLKLFVA